MPEPIAKSPVPPAPPLEQSSPDTESADDNMSETSDIPASLVDGMPQPGDTITLRVVGVDQNTGNITVTKAGGEAESEAPAPPEGGSDQLAAEFNQPPEQG